MTNDGWNEQMAANDAGAGSAGSGDRTCPWCGNSATTFVSRGYAGPTDETNQYFSCGTCGRTTFELIAKSSREMRLGRYKPGDIYQDRVNRTRYQISRVLRVGTNEFLIYLKPLPLEKKDAVTARDGIDPLQ